MAGIDKKTILTLPLVTDATILDLQQDASKLFNAKRLGKGSNESVFLAVAHDRMARVAATNDCLIV